MTDRRLHFLFALLQLWGFLRCQGLPEENPNLLEQELLLQLRRAEVLLEHARARFKEKERLAELNLISRAELDAARTELLKAELDYQQSFLKLFSRTPRISVIEGVKSIADDGSRIVRISLSNTSSVGLDYRRLGVMQNDIPLGEPLRLREIENVQVSLKNDDGAVISEPYEIQIARLQVGESRQLTFRLLQDVEVVTVSMSYAGRLEERKVFLKKDTSANLVTIQPEQISQEADLGTQAVYPLKLERFTSEARVFQLLTVNLPEEIEGEFRSEDSDARVSRILFEAGETTKRVQLRLALPSLAAPERLPLDRPLRFWVVALPAGPGSDAHRGSLQLPPKEIEALQAGKAELEIIPRGLGELEVAASNLFQEIQPDESAEFRLIVKNVGTRSLRNVRISTDHLLDWSSEVEPDEIPTLEVQQERSLRVRFHPPDHVLLGDYSVRMRVEALSGNRSIRAEDLSGRVRVSSPPDLRLTLLLALLLLLFVLGLVLVGIRIARR